MIGDSSVGKKLITGLTGLSLVLFIVIHLIGNLTLLAGAEVFNAYAYTLEHLLHGMLVVIAEVGLLAFFLPHLATGTVIAWKKHKARREGYVVAGSAGGPSQKSVSSLTMIWSGTLLLVFVVLHLIHFKYGPGQAQGYTTVVDGRTMRDLYRLVIEEFNKPLPTFTYVGFMLFLGLHLRHGVWSALQSLGAASPRLTPLLQTVGLVLALILAFGFLVLPLWIFFAVPPPATAAALALGRAG